MKYQFDNKSLVEISKDFSSLPTTVSLTGEGLDVKQLVAVARKKTIVALTSDPKILNRIKTTHQHMISDIKKGVPVYGCNTGYGARASRVLNNGSEEQRIDQARQISEGIIHTDVTVGPPLDASVTRGAMVIRINNLMKGVSGVKIQDLEILRQMLNAQITPIVGQYGGIGASGDLAHNCRVLSAARQIPGTKVWDKEGTVREAKEALLKEKIAPLILDPKAGLGMVNGDNFSTSLAALLLADTIDTLLIALVTGAMVVEVLKGTDRSFHPLLAAMRPHAGQKEVADIYRFLLNGSKLAYQEMAGHKPRGKDVKVQDAYSLRGISQYHGLNVEKLKSYLEMVTINFNSVSDNPLWVPDELTTANEKPWQWVSGGNFLAMYMVEVMDGIRKTLTQIVKLNDRHLARLVNPNENNGLLANLSDDKAMTHCAFKGVQIQSGMFEVYSSLLSVPVSTFFGVHEEGNQDITAHSLTSGIFALENLRIARYSLAQNLLAVCQGVDLCGGAELLSPKTRPIYELIRKNSAYVEVERPLAFEIEKIYDMMVQGEIVKLINSVVFSGYEQK